MLGLLEGAAARLADFFCPEDVVRRLLLLYFSGVLYCYYY